MRNLPIKTLLTGILAATAGALTAAKGRRKQAKQAEAPTPAIGLTTLIHLGPNGVTHEESVHSPLFTPGDEVVVVNPYSHDYAIEELDGTPLYYEIVTARWDEGDRTWRYTLDGESPDEGYAEAWLIEPEHPRMTKEWVADFYDELKTKGSDDAMSMFGKGFGMDGEEFDGLGEAAAKRRKEKAKEVAAEASAEKAYKIDCYLDLLSKGTKEQRELAKERLTELTATDSKKGGE